MYQIILDDTQCAVISVLFLLMYLYLLSLCDYKKVAQEKFTIVEFTFCFFLGYG